MRPIIGKVIYSSILFLILFGLQDYFDIGSSWWITLIIVLLGWFVGSFLYTQFHGTQVMELKHLRSTGADHLFQVIVKTSGRPLMNLVGRYIRAEQFSDLVLQGKIFATLNKFPGSKWIKEFADNKADKSLSVYVDDLGTPFGTTSVELERIPAKTDSKSQLDKTTRQKLEKEVEGMSKYEIGMRLWEEEQKLLAKAREQGLEEQLIAYWESIGRPRMKSPPKKQ